MTLSALKKAGLSLKNSKNINSKRIPLSFGSREGFDVLVESVVQDVNVSPCVTGTARPEPRLQCRILTPRTVTEKKYLRGFELSVVKS